MQEAFEVRHFPIRKKIDARTIANYQVPGVAAIRRLSQLFDVIPNQISRSLLLWGAQHRRHHHDPAPEARPQVSPVRPEARLRAEGVNAG